MLLSSAQFCLQVELLRSGTGQTFAHYDNVQFGAQRLYSTDGKKVLSSHSLFTVQEFAVDKVRLAGAYPNALKAKYVDVTLQQWKVMFKIVNGAASEHETRAERADIHYKELAEHTTSTHPAYLLVSAMHRESTSARMNSKTDTVFDVRGQPTLQEDFVRGCSWPGDEPADMFRVKLSDLQHISGSVSTSSGDSQLPVCSM